MRWGFLQSSFVIVFCCGIAVGIAGAPLWKSLLMMASQAQFGELTFRCDNAMRGHLLAKQKLIGEPSNKNATNLKAAEIGLLDCQNYDLKRKQLIRWGLTDNELSEMALIAIEEKGQDLREVIRVHEIRY